MPPMATRQAKTPEPEPDEGIVWVQVPVPIALHRALKMRAAMDGMSLKDSVLASIQWYVEL
jgi:hypothetical protein